MTTNLREVTQPADLADVDALYRSVFGIEPGDNGLNLRLLVGLTTNSGHLIGAYAAGRLIGFGMSFLARDAPTGRLYQYSQTVAVASDAQTRNVGRAIKYAQRDAALADGLDLMRWVYDPLHARNAHFNLDVLGARLREVRTNFYGAAAPGRDTGEQTDRAVVDWELTAPAPPLATPPDPHLQPGESRILGEALAVAIPADWHAHRRDHGDDAAAALRASIVRTMAAALERGLVAASCRRVDERTAVYWFVPGRTT